MKQLIIIVMNCCLLACSNQQIYEAAKHNEQLNCQELPQSQYEECMDGVSETYESYSRKRKDSVGEE